MAVLGEARAEATVPVRHLGRAREFYEGPLELRPVDSHRPDVDVIYECGGGTRLLIYEHPRSWGPAFTVAHFTVDDVPGAVRDLRARGIAFEEYDLPELKTVDGVATIDGRRFAWFRDLDENIFGLHD
jgi:catechol 2,3-dioxygenase-like lactoylglutathione lyase family enzyme